LGENRAFSNTGSAPLEFMVFGVARNMEAKTAYMLSPEGQGYASVQRAQKARRASR
jgi:hypothetical protein